jgi:hypothetical protein
MNNLKKDQNGNENFTFVNEASYIDKSVFSQLKKLNESIIILEYNPTDNFWLSKM